MSKVFAAPKRQINCSSKCETCTSQTIGSRIKENLSMDKQTVFKHIMSHKRSNKQDKPNPDDITWRIIYENIRCQGERKFTEAIEIQKHSTNIMNGCIGKIITVVAMSNFEGN